MFWCVVWYLHGILDWCVLLVVIDGGCVGRVVMRTVIFSAWLACGCVGCVGGWYELLFLLGWIKIMSFVCAGEVTPVAV